jgi:hypothetical protein
MAVLSWPTVQTWSAGEGVLNESDKVIGQMIEK